MCSSDLAGLVLASNILGVNENILTGIGNAFGAIRSGNIPNLISAAGSLASINPRILSAIAGKGAALAGPLSGGLGLGALGGMNFDIASSLNFVNSITKIFNCDPDPECSPNDTHTMQVVVDLLRNLAHQTSQSLLKILLFQLRRESLMEQV